MTKLYSNQILSRNRGLREVPCSSGSGCWGNLLTERLKSTEGEGWAHNALSVNLQHLIHALRVCVRAAQGPISVSLTAFPLCLSRSHQQRAGHHHHHQQRAACYQSSNETYMTAPGIWGGKDYVSLMHNNSQFLRVLREIEMIRHWSFLPTPIRG